MTIDSNARTHARFYIDSMTTRPYKETHPYRPQDLYDLGQEILRDLLCDGADDLDLDAYDKEYSFLSPHPRYTDIVARELTRAYETLLDDEYSRQYISELCLQNSVCPVHHHDYAICFDDDKDDCRVIRQYFPSHDT